MKRTYIFLLLSFCSVLTNLIGMSPAERALYQSRDTNDAIDSRFIDLLPTETALEIAIPIIRDKNRSVADRLNFALRLLEKHTDQRKIALPLINAIYEAPGLVFNLGQSPYYYFITRAQKNPALNQFVGQFFHKDIAFRTFVATQLIPAVDGLYNDIMQIRHNGAPNTQFVASLNRLSGTFNADIMKFLVNMRGTNRHRSSLLSEVTQTSDSLLPAIQRLIQCGALINNKGHEGNTVLIDAALWNYIGIARELITHGADVNVRNNDNETALTRTTYWNVLDGGGRFTTMIQLLRDAGATLTFPDKAKILTKRTRGSMNNFFSEHPYLVATGIAATTGALALANYSSLELLCEQMGMYPYDIAGALHEYGALGR